jgi:DNA-binding SARP family transcriptional activator
LLGGFNVRLNGHPVAGISYNKMRALLAYLVVEREQDHNRDVLAGLIWSNHDPITARDNLRRALSNLRCALELPSGTILFSGGKHTIRFIPNIYVDVIDFTRQIPTFSDNQGALHNAERIIALYQGDFLSGLSFSGSPDFEDWLLMQRESLHCRALALLEQLSNYYLQIGDYSKSLQFDMRYLELEPWNEDAHRRAIYLYALNGQHSAAIGQYEVCCRLLKKELGVLPSEKTENLVERIRNGEFQQEPSATVSPLLLHTVPPLPSERRQTTVLYCELTLAAIDEPDEAMELLSMPQARCIEIIKQFSGHIVQTHGGGLLAYFGYPQAREDAVRRAVLAALAVTREAVHGIKIRAAVHTGLIITGGEPFVPDTVGKVSQLAIRLRKSVDYGEVAISQQTHSIVVGYFDCISLGVKSIPDIVQALEIFKVVKASGARSRMDVVAQLTPLAGREAELVKLMRYPQVMGILQPSFTASKGNACWCFHRSKRRKPSPVSIRHLLPAASNRLNRWSYGRRRAWRGYLVPVFFVKNSLVGNKRAT